MSLGVKIFERQENKESRDLGGPVCMYRLAQEGLHAILPSLNKQIIRPTLVEWVKLLNERSVPVKGQTEGAVAKAEAAEGTEGEGKPEGEANVLVS